MISWDRVRELRSEIGAEDFHEVVELFLEEVEDVLGRLRTQFDATTCEADLHFLKGSALNLGFERFGALCREGEMKAAENRVGTADVAQVLEAYEASKAEFLAHRPAGA